MTNIYLIETEATRSVIAGHAETQEIVSRKHKQGATVRVYLISTGTDVTHDFL